MPKLKDFFEAGLEGISKRLDTKRLFQEYAQGEDRTLVLRVQTPGSKGEEFGFYVDTNSWQLGVTDSYTIPEPTVRVTILDENLMWLLASRQQNLFSAYYQDLPIDIDGAWVLRDVIILDKVLELIYQCLLADGIDLKTILAPT